MTATFGNITDLIDMADKDMKVRPIIFETLVYCESVVTDERYRMKAWTQMIKEDVKGLWKIISSNIHNKLRSYFSFVHDLDHATHHNAFQPGGYRIVRQLRYLLKNHRSVKRHDFKTLFRESPRALKYFNDRYYHIGYGVYDLKEMKKG